MAVPIAYLLACAGTLATRRSDAALRPYGLTTRQYGLLAQLDLEPELTMSELARQLGISRQTLHEMAADLERAGYLARAPGATGRTRRLALTPRSARRLPRIAATLRAAEAEFFDGIDPAAVDALRRLLLATLAHATDDDAWLG
jgi:DNA-binding MarR family transcriptional regulator